MLRGYISPGILIFVSRKFRSLKLSFWEFSSVHKTNIHSTSLLYFSSDLLEKSDFFFKGSLTMGAHFQCYSVIVSRGRALIQDQTQMQVNPL